jgi:hypothetical protein
LHGSQVPKERYWLKVTALLRNSVPGNKLTDDDDECVVKYFIVFSGTSKQIAYLYKLADLKFKLNETETV